VRGVVIGKFTIKSYNSEIIYHSINKNLKFILYWKTTGYIPVHYRNDRKSVLLPTTPPQTKSVTGYTGVAFILNNHKRKKKLCLGLNKNEIKFYIK
jgi:hypothetical protein